MVSCQHLKKKFIPQRRSWPLKEALNSKLCRERCTTGFLICIGKFLINNAQIEINALCCWTLAKQKAFFRDVKSISSFSPFFVPSYCNSAQKHIISPHVEVCKVLAWRLAGLCTKRMSFCFGRKLMQHHGAVCLSEKERGRRIHQ